MLRCKFRILEVILRMESTYVSGRPVGPKGQCFPNGSEENAAWFVATPSGEYKWWLVEGDEQPTPGDYVFIAIVKADVPADDDWKLGATERTETYRGVSLSAINGKQSLQFDVTNQGAWPTIDAMRPGDRYRVTVTRCEHPVGATWP